MMRCCGFSKYCVTCKFASSAIVIRRVLVVVLFSLSQEEIMSDTGKWKRKRNLSAKMASIRAKRRQLQPVPEHTEPESEAAIESADSTEDELLISPEDSDNDAEMLSEDEDKALDGFGNKEASEIFSEWHNNLPKDDLKVLDVFLTDLFLKDFGYKVKDAAKLVGKHLSRDEKTIRTWRRLFYSNVGSFPVSKKGKYARFSVLDDEDIKEKALTWLRKNIYQKKAQVTAHTFMKYVNEELLASFTLPENAPIQISLRSAYRWMHKMGFTYKKYKRGTFVDGHERGDVVKYRSSFLKKLHALEATHKPPPLPADNLQPPYSIGSAEAARTLVLIFHDETVFHTNEDKAYSWTENGRMKLKPKGQGRGIMISDFVDEHNGYLRLSDEDFARYSKEDPSLKQTARQQIIIGHGNEGYWTNNHFLENVKDAMKIASLLYPPATHNVVFVFDQSSNHCAFSDDSLNAKKMNVGPGGKNVPAMRSTTWNGQPQSMVDTNGRPKGLRKVLEERGINTKRLSKKQMVTILSSHHDFMHEKCTVEKQVTSFGHRILFLPKFHCKFNPIERVWCKAKEFARFNCDYTFASLQAVIQAALQSVTVDDIRKYFRKARDYIQGW